MEFVDWFILITWLTIMALVYVHIWRTIEQIKARNRQQPRRYEKPCDCKTPDICNLNDRCMK